MCFHLLATIFSPCKIFIRTQSGKNKSFFAFLFLKGLPTGQQQQSLAFNRSVRHFRGQLTSSRASSRCSPSVPSKIVDSTWQSRGSLFVLVIQGACTKMSRCCKLNPGVAYNPRYSFMKQFQMLTKSTHVLDLVYKQKSVWFSKMLESGF